MKLKILGLLLLVSIQQIAAAKWWETASFYQIYPRSFKDSDGDGVGDLKGITEKLPYLKEIGITATWISPIFTSPMADFGYDISDFTNIDPLFGTMEDFEALLAKAKQIGIKILLDFVPNHSSDECEWFVKSVAKDKDYKDFYVWHPGKMIDGERHPPTNWISVFRGPAWTFHEERQEYYLHQFHHKQPDLNYRNPKVREMMKDVLRFWLRKGVDGFRVDAVPHSFEIAPDADGNWPDEPRNTNVNDPESYDYLRHIYTVDQPETIELVYEFREVMDEMKAELNSDDLILMTEAYSPTDVLMQYYGNETMEGAQIPFNFDLISNLSNDSNAHHYAGLINGWLDKMPEGRTANWVMGNHDRSRVGSRLGSDRIDLINVLLTTLPGCSVTYMGEEIGMTDVWLSWEETVDPQGCQSNQQEYEKLSRDPVRTPFQWSDDRLAGFTEGEKSWLKVADNYKKVNLKRERGISLSHVNVFKALTSLRNDPAFRHGGTEVKAVNNDVLVIMRLHQGSFVHFVLFNIFDTVQTVNLKAVTVWVTDEVEYVLVTSRSVKRKGDRVNSEAVKLMPKEAVVLRTTAKL